MHSLINPLFQLIPYIEQLLFFSSSKLINLGEILLLLDVESWELLSPYQQIQLTINYKGQPYNKIIFFLLFTNSVPTLNMAAGLKPSTTLLLSNKLKAPSLRATIPLLRK